MGRKSGVPVNIQIQISNEISTTAQLDQLPIIQPFIDIENGRSGKELQISRLYFFRPTQIEAKNAKSIGYHLIGAVSTNGIYRSSALGDYAKEKVSELFGQQLSQLIIYSYSGIKLSLNSVRNRYSSIKHFIDFLSKTVKKDNYSIFSIQYEDWLNYRLYIEESVLKDKKQNFKTPISLFAAFPPTSFSGSLTRITGSYNQNKPIIDGHSSILNKEDGSYSDAVMYQLLAQFIFRFERQIDNLKYYENLSVDGMCDCWINPNVKATRLKDPNSRFLTDHFTQINDWLSDEDGYKKILDHKLMWFKLGQFNDNSFSRKIQHHTVSSESLKIKANSYDLWEKDTHFLNGSPPKSNIFGLYVKRNPALDKTGSMSQLAFCLANIVMIYTGLNKEVVLSWPSKVNGKSILDLQDSLFIKDDGSNNEIEISGIKSRTGNLTNDKKIRIAIVIGSPLYNMLKAYEKHAKTNTDDQFFEFSSKGFERVWGGKPIHFKNYKVLNDNGELLTSINTTKFRKVFATTKMLEHMSGIKSSQNLANCLRHDLDHNNLDVTLSNYILKSQHSTNVLDMAIVTITSEKIKQALKFQGKIAVNQNIKAERAVYLCECSDPLNPSHGIAISKRCNYYDLCLGCKQSIVFEMHLPYICFRILQYEDRRLEMGNEWSAIFEDKWMIAHDALNRYKEQDKKNGERLIENAWLIARSSEVLLPAIIMTKF